MTLLVVLAMFAIIVALTSPEGRYVLAGIAVLAVMNVATVIAPLPTYLGFTALIIHIARRDVV